MNSNRNRTISQIGAYQKNILNGKSELSLTDIINSAPCQKILSECREFRDRIYTPVKTIFLFVKQVLNPDKSCKRAVAGAVIDQISVGLSANSNNTGPYCKARKRLPESAVKSLVKTTGSLAMSQAKSGWKIYGRQAKIVDGTMSLMPDTAENQKQFPQHGNQKKGLGFPLARLVIVMSLTVGTILDYAIGANKGKGTGEHSLLRNILDCIESEDIVLGDCYYPSFF
jgi:Transposase DDE domain